MKNTEVRVDLGSVEVRIDQGANLPIKRCELTKVESPTVRADHKPIWSSRAYMTFSTNFQRKIAEREICMVGRCNFYLFFIY